MAEVSGVNPNEYLRMKINAFNKRVEYDTHDHFDRWQDGGDDDWTYAKLGTKQSAELQNNADGIYSDLMENKITIDEAHTAFDVLEQQYSELTGQPVLQRSDDPTATALDYHRMQNDEFSSKCEGNEPSDKESLGHASRGIVEGLTKGELTVEQAADLRQELNEHRQRLKDLNKYPLTEEEQAEKDTINVRLQEIQDESGYVPPEPFAGFHTAGASNTSSSSAYQGSGLSPNEDKPKSSRARTAAILVGFGLLAVVAAIFFPVAIPLIIGVAVVAAVLTVAYRHGPEIISAFKRGGRPVQMQTSNVNNNAPEVEHEGPEVEEHNKLEIEHEGPEIEEHNKLEIEHEGPEIEEHNKLEVEHEGPEVEQHNELEVEHEGPEVESVNTTHEDIKESSIPTQRLEDSPVEQLSAEIQKADLKDTLDTLPEALSQRSSTTPSVSNENKNDDEDEHRSSMSMN